ncbi:MAG: ATP-binding protein [Clostridia bacterium]|nr:ATP-binding protein [Clostridia bacterium]
MLLDFSINNYLSYGSAQTFSTICNADKAHVESNTAKVLNNKVSLVSVIFGANASGKTGLFRGMNFVRQFFLHSNGLSSEQHIPVRQFKFDNKLSNMPCQFELTFVKNGIKYVYGFSCTATEVIDEYLDMYKSSKPTNVFTRSNVNNYVFSSDQRLLKAISLRNPPNKLFVCTASSWNYEVTQPVVEFVISDLYVVFDYRLNSNLIESFKRKKIFDEYKNFCIKLLNHADLNISDFKMNDKKLNKESPYYSNLISALKLLTNKDSFDSDNFNVLEFQTVHDINGEKYLLKLEDESFGTQNLFNVAPILFQTLKYGKTLVLDEIDRSMHPLLVKYIVELFCDKDINKNNAQLICNSHDTNLQDLDILRRDQIWFAEKDYETGMSRLFSLADFSPRKTENVEKNYLVGRYGSVPFITKGGDLWED